MKFPFKKNLDCIHILGKGETWTRCPGANIRVDLKNQEIWTLNSMFKFHNSVDRVFLMHDPRQEVIFEDRDYFKLVRDLGRPIYTNQIYSVLGENNYLYPVDEVLARFPIIYFTNAACWMLALAILLEPKKIALHGIDMRTCLEYANERGGVEFWVGVATGAGIEVDIPDGSAICTCNSVWGSMYGFIPITSNGLLIDWKPDYRGFNRPEIFEQYQLVPILPEDVAPINEWEPIEVEVDP